jgi:hypothetical protein
MAGARHRFYAFRLAAVLGLCLMVAVSCVSASPPVRSSDALPAITPIRAMPTPTLRATQTTLPSTDEPEGTGLDIAVPHGKEALIDGSLSADEWESATQIDLADDNQLFLMHAGGYLFLGIRGMAEPVISICIDQADQISILHSSAAIGTAVYRLGGGVWQQVRSFDWCCRDTTDRPQAQEERRAHLEDQGWIASNGRMGIPQQVEFQISLPGDSLRLAFSSIGAPDYESVISWPGGLADGCSSPDMLKGPIPEETQFSLEDWITLTMD